MTDREKLIELLRHPFQMVRGNTAVVCRRMPTQPAEELADHLIANGVTIEEWIPVSDPPKENGSYLVATERGGVFITHYWKDGQRFSSRGGRTVITHWKERPMPPKEE